MKIILKKTRNNYIPKEKELRLLQKNLKKYYGINYLQIDYNNNGKPYLKNHRNIHFSISHTNDFLAIAISKHNIGIDIEKIRNYNLKINNLLNINPKNKETFFKEWTKREAVIKLKGLALKDINNLDYSNIKIVTKKYKNYIITIAEEI